jgi:hypothetical protein
MRRLQARLLCMPLLLLQAAAVMLVLVLVAAAQRPMGLASPVLERRWKAQ